MNKEWLRKTNPMYRIQRNMYLLRKKRKWTSEALATFAGISKGLLSKLENDLNSNPSLHTLDKIALAFGIQVEELIK